MKYILKIEKNINTTSKTKVIILLFIIALAIRIISASIAYRSNIMAGFGDDIGRMQYALKVLEEGPFVTNIENIHALKPEAKRAPGLPWIMAVTILFFGNSWLPIFLLNALIGSLTCVLIFLICEEFTTRSNSFLAGLWGAFYVSYIRTTASAGNEVWASFLVVLIIFTIIKLLVNYNALINKYMLLLVSTFALLIHIDERYLAYFLYIFLILLFLIDNDLKNSLKKALFFAITVLVLMVPWLVRNYIVYDNLVILTTRTTLITKRFINYDDNLIFKPTTTNYYLTESQIDSVINGLKTKFNYGGEIDPLQVAAMKDGHTPHKFSKFEAHWSRFKILWQPIHLKGFYRMSGFNYEGKWSLRHNLSIGLSYGLLIPFLIIGLLALYQKYKKISVLLISVLIYHTVIHVLFVPQTRFRYRIPVDSVVIILGVYGMLISYQYIKKRVSDKNVDDISSLQKNINMPSSPS